MAILSFIILTKAEADEVAGENAAGTARLEPRRVEDGPQAGRFVLPLSVLGNALLPEHQALLAGLPLVELDTEEAWPAEP